jgi:hypothetical protein
MPLNDQPAPSTAAMIRLPPRRGHRASASAARANGRATARAGKIARCYEDLETRRAAMTRAAKERAARAGKIARRYEDLETWRAAMTRTAKERAARPDEMKQPEAVGDAFAVPCAIDGAASRRPTTASPS